MGKYPPNCSNETFITQHAYSRPFSSTRPSKCFSEGEDPVSTLSFYLSIHLSTFLSLYTYISLTNGKATIYTNWYRSETNYHSSTVLFFLPKFSGTVDTRYRLHDLKPREELTSASLLSALSISIIVARDKDEIDSKGCRGGGMRFADVS